MDVKLECFIDRLQVIVSLVQLDITFQIPPTFSLSVVDVKLVNLHKILGVLFVLIVARVCTVSLDPVTVIIVLPHIIVLVEWIRFLAQLVATVSPVGALASHVLLVSIVLLDWKFVAQPGPTVKREPPSAALVQLTTIVLEEQIKSPVQMGG